MALLAGMVLLAIVGFMVIGVRGSWDFALQFRGGKLAVMLVVAYCVALSSVLFQTITHNRILTPTVMGFDSLFMLIQAIAMYAFYGAGGLSPTLTFIANVLIMTGCACLLFRWVSARDARSIHLLLLVGIVCSMLFRSLASFVIRLIDPNEFLVLQDRLFANFNTIDIALLPIAIAVIAAASTLFWRMRRDYDVMALGRDAAINLGVNYTRTLTLTLVGISILVSASTALVGPIAFFGLLVSNMAYQTIRTHQHTHIVLAAVLYAVLFLVGGQIVLEHLLSLNATISVIVEFLGGLLFLFLVLRRGAR
ncbi:enterobactin ABC transporter permease [Pseudomonas sp. PA15(2017)]|uniref:iron chelate uptake ABC transporter family permease subunit n=1 Tax=Pseudomonas sp. PA15(2017) TaxID=1932111 RepID=UPI000966694A|nr:iron chelate uptake ABC transporter family permease subunit [Pseudomonas sp. PA15(2017)]OLU34884.1 enterobactin ABC transporter permease [Pseudomonas sp. PA15(2017)]